MSSGTEPEICVISVNYRSSSDTAAEVRSLRKSEVATTVVVVDSTPNDPEIVSALSFDGDVTLLRARENVGFGRANNMGIRWALANTKCKYFFLLNNDAVVLPDTISTLLAELKRSSDIGIVVPRIVYHDAPEILWYGGGDVDWRRASAFTPGFNQSSTSTLAMTERDVTFATGCALLIRRELLETLGGFDPRFFMYEEDLELSLRVIESGYRLRYVPQALVRHRVQGSSRGNNQDRTNFWSTSNPRLSFYAFHIIRNRLLNASIHARGSDWLKITFFFPLFLIRRSIPFLLGGRPDAVLAMLKGIVDFLKVRRKSPGSTLDFPA